MHDEVRALQAQLEVSYLRHWEVSGWLGFPHDVIEIIVPEHQLLGVRSLESNVVPSTDIRAGLLEVKAQEKRGFPVQEVVDFSVDLLACTQQTSAWDLVTSFIGRPGIAIEKDRQIGGKEVVVDHVTQFPRNQKKIAVRACVRILCHIWRFLRRVCERVVRHDIADIDVVESEGSCQLEVAPKINPWQLRRQERVDAATRPLQASETVEYAHRPDH